MAPKKSFTPELIEDLKASPYIETITDQTLKVSDTFRELFYQRYAEGEKPVEIFRDCGIGPEVIGTNRVFGIIRRLKEFDTFEAFLEQRKKVKERRFSNLSEENEYLRHQLLLIEQENEFLKKNIELHRKHRTQ